MRSFSVRSVYVKILLWCFATLLLSLVAFMGVSVYVSITSQHGERGGGFRMNLEDSVSAYESGGPQALAARLGNYKRYFGDDHYLTDPRGKDLVTGEDRSAFLAAMNANHPKPVNGRMVLVLPSADGRYRLIVRFSGRVNFWTYLPYYLLILVAVALVCWMLAINIASPLRTLARTVDRFGAGDLAARVNTRRKDEIGELGRAFDRMAERIATLLTAERRLLQDISHELRSPLARLSFAAELIRTAPDRDAAVARLKKEIARLADLVGGLIQVTRAEGDPSAGNAEELRLDKLLDEIVGDCQMEAEARGCHIALEAEPQLTMRGDRELLRRAIENVVRNSIRYSPGGGAVDVKLGTTKDSARISVRDYGPGVPQDVLPKIFQPFFRVDDSRDTSTGGVGLGLAIAHRAIGLHHGRLWAENVKPGLTVWIELPLVA
ncbi:MAG TPA: ATP-binding protein [Candidatus Solibacter sp.]|nr:ATP-binding protein [Candidatus Solibacter sp.]